LSDKPHTTVQVEGEADMVEQTNAAVELIGHSGESACHTLREVFDNMGSHFFKFHSLYQRETSLAITCPG